MCMMMMNSMVYFQKTIQLILLTACLQTEFCIYAAKEPTINFDVNGFYLDDMLTYSPARFGEYLNSTSSNFSLIAAEANRPQELQCPSMNVISTRYRCKVNTFLKIMKEPMYLQIDVLICRTFSIEINFLLGW